MSGYVYQDDIFVASLTPMEHLQFTVRPRHRPGVSTQTMHSTVLDLCWWNIQARLKMGDHLTSAERDRRIEQLLTELGLFKCRRTAIGAPSANSKSLSGGERKRLSFAAQVLTDPAVLFCDEPTTGLDAYTAERLVLMLKGWPTSGIRSAVGH